METNQELALEHARLSWWILEKKYIYYLLGGDHKQAVLDSEYDRAERRYRELSEQLNLEPTATNMVGFDQERPSCQLVECKLQSKSKR